MTNRFEKLVNENQLRQAAKRIIEHFKTDYLNQEGFISRTFPISSRTIFNHFDDIAPFFIYFGETKFLLKQAVKLKTVSFEETLANGAVLYSYQIDEYVGGLFTLWKESKNGDVKEVLDEALEKIEQYFISDDNLLGTYNIVNKTRSLHYYYWSAGLLETFLEMRDFYPDFAGKARRITDAWLKNEFYRKEQLFPFRYSDNAAVNNLNRLASVLKLYRRHLPSLKRFGSSAFLFDKITQFIFTCCTSGHFVQLMKSNSTFVFCLILLYSETGDEKYKRAVLDWIEAVLRKMYQGGVVYGEYYPGGKKQDTQLVNSFIFIDLLMDTYAFLQDDSRYLDIAKKIIDIWLARRWENGLMPMSEESDKTHLDNLVDFSISMRRYAELSGNGPYREASVKLMESALLNHVGPKGYYTYVYRGVSPLNNSRVNVVDPKYNALLLKGIINMLTIQEDIYGSPYSKLHDIFKDR